MAVLETLFGKGRWKLFIEGYVNTIIIAVTALIIGVVIGTLIALCKVIPRNKWWGKFLNGFGSVYLTVIRGTPVLVQLMIYYFILFPSLRLPALLVAIIGFGINSGAYVGEIIRGGMLSVAKGQMEAGRSLGLSYSQTMMRIIIPQAVKNILPALGNEAIVLVKETSVASVITVMEFWNAATKVGTASYDVIAPYLFAAAVYLVTVMLMSFGLSKLERRLRRGDAR